MVSIFVCEELSFIYILLHFPQTDLFKPFFQGSSHGHSSIFLFYLTVFISPLFLKASSTGYRLLGWWAFLSQHFRYFTLFSSSLHGFWEVTCDSYIFLLYVRCFFWLLSKFFSCTLDFLWFKIICLCVSLFYCLSYCAVFRGIYSAWCSLRFLTLWFNIYH